MATIQYHRDACPKTEGHRAKRDKRKKQDGRMDRMKNYLSQIGMARDVVKA
jgi:hypothetical protein